MGILDPFSDPASLGILSGQQQGGIDPMMAFAGQFLANNGPSFQPHSVSSAMGHGLQGAQAAMVQAQQQRMLLQQHLAQQQHMAAQNKLLEQQAKEHQLNQENQAAFAAERAKLGPNATAEDMANLAQRFATKPGDLLTNFNTRSRNDATKEATLSRISMARMEHLRRIDNDISRTNDQDERRRLMEERLRVDQYYKNEAMKEARAKLVDAGVAIQPAGTPPPMGGAPVPQGLPEGVPPEHAGILSALRAGAAPGAAPMQLDMGNYNPARQVDISGATPQPMPQPAPAPSQPMGIPMAQRGPATSQGDIRALENQPQSAPVQQPIPAAAVTAQQPMGVPMAERKPAVALSPRDQRALELARQKAEIVAPDSVIQGDALEMAAERYKLDGTLPTNLGRGQQGARNTIKILDRAAAIAKDSGDTAEEIRIKQIGVKAKSVALNANTKDLTAIRPYNAMLEKNGDIAIDLASKAIATNSQFANRPINWLRMNASDDPAVAEFLAQARIVSTEAARVLNNPRLVGELTDTARKDMDLVINGNMPLKAFSTVIRRMQQDGKNRVDAMVNENERLTRSLGRGEATPQRRASDNTPTPSLVQKGEVVDGWEYTGPNSDSRPDRANRMNWKKKQ